MRRWMLIPLAAIAVIVIGLVWNFAALNSTTTAANEPTQKLQTGENNSSTANGHDQSASPTTARQQTATVPGVITTSAQQPLTEPEQSTGAKRLLDSLSKEELQDLIAAAGQNAVKEAINRVAPSVVQISVVSTSNPYQGFFNEMLPGQPEQRQSGVGSGFFIEHLGQRFVLTNNHVIENAQEISLSTSDGRSFDAEVVGTDERRDLAVLRVVSRGSENVPAVTLGNSDLAEVGDFVTAIGNPYGLDHTVTSGIISSLGRDISRPDRGGNFQDMIQTDAAINPGNSGGPLVNAKGEIIGINTAILALGSGLGFAIPINMAKESLDRMVQGQVLKRAWLGILIGDLTDDFIAQEKLSVQPGSGVYVNDVIAGSPSDGLLKPGDIVLSIGGASVHSVAELIDNVQYRNVGDSVQLEVLRADQKLTLDVVLGERPSEEELSRRAPAERNAPNSGKNDEDLESAFGITVEVNSEALASQLGLPTSKGVVIVNVAPGSIAEKFGLQPNDVILELNDRQINSVAEWNKAITDAENASRVTIHLLSGKVERIISFSH